MSPIEYLNSQANSHHARLISLTGEVAIYGVRAPSPSDAPVPEIILEVRRLANTVTVKERVPVLLPAFCAERHINPDGSFCLYWGEVENSKIASAEEAEAWWGKVLTFILRQRSASARRRWPGKGDARAHGSAAASFQALAELNAAALGPRFLDTLRDGRLRSKRRGANRLALFRDGRRLFTVLEDETRVMSLRQRCKCEDADNIRLPIASCGSHRRDLAELVINLAGWDRSEKAFYDYLRSINQTCCGTMDDCPLAAAQEECA
ncbi:E2 domain-associated cysteine-rich protein [uncultured Agrobacterium sp.]|uniref:E2 domain-associated cysteine-rich protein n=1 Tax=uncultured Agrobacterium sp. TaxID=157277 RepID=UPI0025E53512|nr:E2 domain-associated cysteine-rich protein [uncultured Agrobacterium sp.]